MQQQVQDVNCVGFIMDGNRRWAKERGLPSFEGHSKGYNRLKEVVEWCRDMGIKNIVVYAFSTENWGRAHEEVSYILGLFKRMIREEIDTIVKDDVHLKFIGDLSRFPDDLREMMQDAAERTKDNRSYTLAVAASYGGRPDILQAANRAIAEGKQVTEESFSELLWTGGMPDPDLIVRTGGEKRLSNFLPWQSTYSELFFTDTYWPDFSKEEFQRILEEYGNRTRRHGK